ncbi:uncharacterized protein C22orf15 isoform X1 [Rhinichthys klamathensis goyatoka]|uniref:uncharacterized protein C22orf15 isoform X1 n=1 Tax=Rhinichthys klamathensis goyatoka TaxID=3034132 RepID=UPI0024B4F187|nr:uncharacterized protein C22orf15 isoform X1 [Rhinichthys klamathensis goyatoka]
MFITVIFGEGREEILNLNCEIINFIHCIKEKCNLDPQETVDLMDRTGELVNLAERAQSTDLVCSLLKERESYIPLRVSRGEGSEGPKYSAVYDFGTSYPELAEILRKLSNPSKEKDRKGGASKRGGVSQNRNKAAINFKKAITTPRN